MLSIGHATDHNSTEVIYKMGDGNGNSNGVGDTTLATSGDNIYQVCTVRDGMRNCGNNYWSGPKPIRTTVATVWQYNPPPGYGWVPGYETTYSPTGTLVGDFTGHGKTEILWYCNDNTQNQNSHNDNPAAETVPTICGMPGWQLYTSNVNPQGLIATDRLVSVQNGTGNNTVVNYKPLSDTSVYVQQPSDKTGVSYPVRRVADGGRMVVSSVVNDTGSGNTATTSYFYEGLATDTTGRGDQGFERITITDPQGTIHSTQYAQKFPYTGMELGHAMFASTSELVNTDCSTYNLPVGTLPAGPNLPGLLDFSCNQLAVFTNPAGTGAAGGVTVAQIPYAAISQQLSHNDLDGSLLPLMTHSMTLTNYGDVLNETTQSIGQAGQPASGQADTYTTTTANTWNYVQSPYVAELLVSAVTKFSTNSAVLPVTRIKQHDYYGQTAPGLCTPVSSGLPGNTGLLADEIITGAIGTSGQAPSITSSLCSASIALQTSYGHDSNGNVNQTNQYWTDTINGAQSRVLLRAWFDANGRYLVKSLNAIDAAANDGLYTYYQFDQATGAKTSLTDTNNLTTHWVPDGFGRTTAELRPDNTESDFAIVQCGTSAAPCPANVDGQLGHTATVVSHYSNVNGSKTQIAVPEVSLIDTAGHTVRHVTWGYDGSEIDSDSTYDADGRLDHSWQPLFNGSRAYLHHQDVYDELNRVTQHIEHDEVGNPLVTLMTYNGMNTSVTNPKSFTKVENHDALGQVVRMQDTMGNFTTYTRDAWGNLQTVVAPGSSQTQIVSDALGHKTDLIDPDLGHLRYCTDARGLTWQQISPIAANAIGLGNVSNASYCSTAWTTQAENMKFDLLDRMVSRTEPSLNSYWIYDSTSGRANCAAGMSCGALVQACTGGDGKGCGASDTPAYVRNQSYDNLGRPSSTNSTVSPINGLSGSFVTTNNYDSWGRLCGIFRQAGNGPGVTFASAYSSSGYLSQVVRVGTTSGNDICSSYVNGSYNQLVLWQADEQDASSRVTASSLGNGLTVSRSYDPYTGHLADSSVVSSAGGNIGNVVSEGYQYDVLGNVSNRTEAWGNSNNFSEGFGYDALNRLTSSQVMTQPLQSFGFNNLGNITSKTGVGVGTVNTNGTPNPGTYSYSQSACSGVSGAAVSGPHAVTSIQGITTGNNGAFCYDADGNMLNDPWRSTSWTSFDMPSQITEGSYHSQFIYGPEHQRLSQIRGDITMLYADGMEIDTPTSGSGGMSSNTFKTYWPSGLGVEISTGGAAPVYNWTHSDNLDSVVAITDAHGNLVQSMAYDAWGARRSLTGAPGVDSAANGYLDGTALIDNKGFTHQEELDQLGLVHLNGRVYDPFTGRFLSGDPEVQDPYHSQSYNRYTYVWNNPTNFNDPTGFTANDPSEQPKTEADWDKMTASQKRAAFNAWEHGTGDGLGNSTSRADNSNATKVGPTANSGGTTSIFKDAFDFFTTGSISTPPNPANLQHHVSDAMDEAADEAATHWWGYLSDGQGGTMAQQYATLARSSRATAYAKDAVYGPLLAIGATAGIDLAISVAGGVATGKMRTSIPEQYWIDKRPLEQVTPGVRTINQEKPSSAGGTYHQTVHYDEFGRTIGRTDRTNHGYSDPKASNYHPNPHHHRVNPINKQNLKDPNTGSKVWPGWFGS